MAADLQKIYDRLYAYCAKSGFAGPDPFDGLNSTLFQHTPLKHLRPARLAWLQMIKRSPVDLRGALGVSEGVNPKALALFALAELSRFRASRDERHAGNARSLLGALLALRISGTGNDGSETTAFGYNFDWQSRVFYAKVGTPAIVPMAFAAQAFIEAYETLDQKEYLETASEICSFILSDLNRPVESPDEICFSYTPIDNTIIFNASLLAGETLSRVGAMTGKAEYLSIAEKTARFVIRRRRGDGSWTYGAASKQGWADNFHTAYVLLSLFRIARDVEPVRAEAHEAILIGTKFWIDNFFTAEGAPKYYHDAIYPIDIHSAAVAIAALHEMSAVDPRARPMAEKVAAWTIENMLDEDGYFYYQKRKGRTIRTPFMRWGQAWMAYALARAIEAEAMSHTDGD